MIKYKDWKIFLQKLKKLISKIETYSQLSQD